MKLLLIHIEPVNRPPTKRNLTPQQPSWNPAAISFLARHTKNTKIWKHVNAKLILIIIDAPKHADLSTSPPDASGHPIQFPGIQLTMSFAENISPIEIKIQKTLKKTYPILEKLFYLTPAFSHGLQRHPQQSEPAQHNAEPAQQRAPPIILR